VFYLSTHFLFPDLSYLPVIITKYMFLPTGIAFARITYCFNLIGRCRVSCCDNLNVINNLTIICDKKAVNIVNGNNVIR